MNRIVVIVGTKHDYQRGDGSCSQGDITKFRAYLGAVCSKWLIQLIAEEMSQASTVENSSNHSTVALLAADLNIQHRYVDPDREQRKKLQIRDVIYVRASGELAGLPEATILKKINAECRKRESVWLEALLTLEKWPSLFVCGSKHVDSFSDSLRNSNIDVQIESRDWAP